MQPSAELCQVSLCIQPNEENVCQYTEIITKNITNIFVKNPLCIHDFPAPFSATSSDYRTDSVVYNYPKHFLIHSKSCFVFAFLRRGGDERNLLGFVEPTTLKDHL